MKKRVDTYKTFCDSCGKETEGDNFKLPIFTSKSKYAYDCNHTPIIEFNHNVLEKRDCDLCIDCQTKFAYLLKLISYVKIDDGEVKISFTE